VHLGLFYKMSMSLQVNQKTRLGYCLVQISYSKWKKIEKKMDDVLALRLENKRAFHR
jgi:uncharacterized membrane protein YobD (UPF0266 family)